MNRKARQLAEKVDDAVWTTDVLNLWDGPSEASDKLGVIGAIKQVSVTGRKQAGRTQVVIDGQSRWVTSDYLSAEKPKPEPKEPAGPSLGGVCANGSSIDAGHASLYDIHDVVCANWPSVTSYGTWRGDGEHGQGRAIDIMVSGETGWAIAELPACQLRLAGHRVHHLLAEHLVRGALRRGLARDVRPWVDDRQPLRPRARHGLLRRGVAGVRGAR